LQIIKQIRSVKRLRNRIRREIRGLRQGFNQVKVKVKQIRAELRPVSRRELQNAQERLDAAQQAYEKLKEQVKELQIKKANIEAEERVVQKIELLKQKTTDDYDREAKELAYSWGPSDDSVHQYYEALKQIRNYYEAELNIYLKLLSEIEAIIAEVNQKIEEEAIKIGQNVENLIAKVEEKIRILEAKTEDDYHLEAKDLANSWGRSDDQTYQYYEALKQLREYYQNELAIYKEVLEKLQQIERESLVCIKQLFEGLETRIHTLAHQLSLGEALDIDWGADGSNKAKRDADLKRPRATRRRTIKVDDPHYGYLITNVVYFLEFIGLGWVAKGKIVEIQFREGLKGRGWWDVLEDKVIIYIPLRTLNKRNGEKEVQRIILHELLASTRHPEFSCEINREFERLFGASKIYRMHLKKPNLAERILRSNRRTGEFKFSFLDNKTNDAAGRLQKILIQLKIMNISISGVVLSVIIDDLHRLGWIKSLDSDRANVFDLAKKRVLEKLENYERLRYIIKPATRTRKNRLSHDYEIDWGAAQERNGGKRAVGFIPASVIVPLLYKRIISLIAKVRQGEEKRYRAISGLDELFERILNQEINLIDLLVEITSVRDRSHWEGVLRDAIGFQSGRHSVDTLKLNL